MATRSKKARSNSLTTLVNLTPEEVRRLAKPRDGFMDYAKTLLSLYAGNADELSIKGQTPENAAAELEAYQTLLEMESAAQAQLDRIQETRALHAANLWTTMLDIYARARSAGRNDVAMTRAVSDFAHFLKRKPKKGAHVVATPVTTPTPVAA